MAGKQSQNFPPVTLFLFGLLIIAAFFLGTFWTRIQFLEKQNTIAPTPAPQAAQPNAPTPGKKVNVDTGHFPLLGNKDAKVTIIEFADFQCPFCERFYTATEQDLIKNYVDKGLAKFAFRNYAFLGQESTWAAEAVECANEQGKFWDFHNYLYTHQGGENSGAFAKDKLEGFAKDLGLNTNQFNSCLDSDKYAKNVADDLAAGKAAGVNGTPGTFVNGQLIVGAQPFNNFKDIIDKELQKK